MHKSPAGFLVIAGLLFLGSILTFVAGFILVLAKKNDPRMVVLAQDRSPGEFQTVLEVTLMIGIFLLGSGVYILFGG